MSQTCFSPTAAAALEAAARRAGLSNAAALVERIAASPELLAAAVDLVTRPACYPRPGDAVVLRPPEPATPIVATIAADKRAVWLRSEFDERIVAVCRARRMGWDDKARRWERQITPRSGPAIDRLVELGSRLLAAGVSVHAPSEEVRRRIEAGDYLPETRRTVHVTKRGDGYLVSWPDGESWMAALAVIPGCHAEPGFAILPAECDEEALDFAEQHGFRLTDAAKKLAARAAEERRNAYLVQPIVRRAETGKAAGRRKLATPESVEIDRELADDD